MFGRSECHNHFSSESQDVSSSEHGLEPTYNQMIAEWDMESYRERIIVLISNDMLCTALLNSTPQSMITWSLSVWEYGISIPSMRSRWVEVIFGKQSFQYQYIFKHTPSISAEFCLLVDLSV